jgi:hypothetical protein
MRATRDVLIGAILACLAPRPIAAQVKITITPSVETAEKGKVFEINARIETAQALDSLRIVALAPENFCVRPVPVSDQRTYSTSTDGSVLVPFLASSSAVTVQFRVVAPAQFRFSKSTCLPADSTKLQARSLDNTRDNRTFVFNGRYRPRSDTVSHAWTEAVTVKYTTSQAIFLWSGMLGVVLGYVVKSLTTRKPEADAVRAEAKTAVAKAGNVLVFLFGTSIDKLLTSLVLGFGALLTIQKSGIPVGGAASAVLAGITIGILADDALISRISK